MQFRDQLATKMFRLDQIHGIVVYDDLSYHDEIALELIMTTGAKQKLIYSTQIESSKILNRLNGDVQRLTEVLDIRDLLIEAGLRIEEASILADRRLDDLQTLRRAGVTRGDELLELITSKTSVKPQKLRV